jgi:G3E family GTPase
VNSDVILVNKTDLADEPVIAAAESLISSINPRAILFRTINAGINVPLPDAPPQRTIVTGNCHFHFETASFRLSGKPQRGAFTAFFDELARGLYGSVVRAKAIVATDQGPYRYDLVFGRVDSMRHEKSVRDSRVVVIGNRLDSDAIRKVFE